MAHDSTSSRVKMRITVFLLALGIAAVAAVPKNPQRIVGGSTTTIGQYPTIVSLLFSQNVATFWQSCGGTLINTRSILSATHCFIRDRPAQWRVRVGSTFANSGGVVHNFERFIFHPNYNIGATLNNDIAVLRTTSTISYVNNAAQPATIAGANYNVPDNAVVWAAGWGRTASNGPASEQLRHVQMWTINLNTCTQRYREVGSVVNSNMLCSGWLDVGGRDQCQGDSGGPLYHNNVVVGVCSWGRGCALARYPGVNVRVSAYTNWILQNA